MSLFETTNGGVSWTRRGVGPVPSSFQLAIAPDGSPWALAAVGQTAGCAACQIGAGPLTVQNGKVEVTAHALPGGATPTGLVPLSAAAAVAIVDGPTAAETFLTTNQGVSWQTISSTPQWLFPQTGVGFWTQSQGWGVGASLKGPEFLATSDGGRTWSALAPYPSGQMVSLNWSWFSSRSDGWVVELPSQTGLGGLAVTTDGGRSWTRRDLPSGFDVALSFENSSHGIFIVDRVKGGPPVLDVTTNGGRTWKTVLKGATAAAWGPTGWVFALTTSGHQTQLVRSENGGRSWQVIHTLAAGLGASWVGEAADGTVWAASSDRIWLWPPGSAGVEIQVAAKASVGGPSTAIASGLQSAPSVISARVIEIFTGQAVYRTLDGAKTWSLMAQGPAG